MVDDSTGPLTCHPEPLGPRGVALVRVAGPWTASDQAALRTAIQALTDAVLATRRVVHLQPARPRRTRTPATLWAWAALGLPCRHPVDGIRRCRACPCCQARDEALRTWCP